MNILYITTVYSTFSQFLESHVMVLVNKGNQVHIACSLGESFEFRDSNYKLHDVPFSRSLLKNDLFLIRKKLLALIEYNNIDIIHVHTPIASAIVRIVLPTKQNYKLYYTSHGFHFHPNSSVLNWIYFAVEWFLSFKTDKLITINNWDYKIAKRFFNAGEVVKCNGVGLFQRIPSIQSKIRSELAINDNDFVLINVAEHNKNKNQKILLKIVKDLSNPRLHLMLVGHGKLTDYYRNYIESNNLQSNVHLLGYRKDIDELLKESNLFVFPSKREGLGMALIEALVQKMKFLAFDIRGIRDITIGKYNNRLIKPYSYVDFRDAIRNEFEKYMIDPKNYNEQYLDLDLDRFSIDNALDFISELYE